MGTLKEIEGKIFGRHIEWENIDKEKALENTRILDLLREACLIESFFGVYVGHMMELFGYDVEATSMFTIEAFEAYGHYFMLKKYLDIIGYKPLTEEEVVELRKKDKHITYNDEIKELVNFMATEHFAANFFQDVSEITNEPVLKKMLITFSKEEVTHSKFAFDLLAKRLKKNPDLKNSILSHAKDFQHIGAYVFPTVSSAKEDNIKIIQSFNKKIADLVGESLSDYITKERKL